MIIDKDEIKEMTGHLKTISEAERMKFEMRIIMEEVSQTLKNTRNNITPSSRVFSGAF